jgi:hypothetical protein
MKVETTHKITITHDDIVRAIVRYLKEEDYLDKDIKPTVVIIYGDDDQIGAEISHTTIIE